MSSSSEQPVQTTEKPRSRVGRTRARAAAVQARTAQVADRAQAERANHKTVDAMFELVDRDTEVAGGIIAGALAYRFFIWALPFGLVLVAGLGVAADAASESSTKAAKDLGLAGLVSSSVAHASQSSTRLYALVVGIPLLFYATRSVLRVMIGSHRLVWTDLRQRAPRPTMKATALFLALLLLFFVLSGLAGYARSSSSFLVGLLVSLVMIVPYGGIWLLISLRLPHQTAGWMWLVPGALLFGAGIELVQVAIAYFIAPLTLNKEGTYGALGIAAGLLLGFFFIARLMVGSAVLNATLWERHVRSRAATAAATAQSDGELGSGLA
jgi:uncharacterized BrkB/YihY/UPF0761 family membrane protein